MKIKKPLTFITGNVDKLAEVQAILPFVRGKHIDLPEIQESDLYKVVQEKLRVAVAQHTGPVMVDDTGLFLDCFASRDGSDGLPGPFIKWFLQTVTNEGLAAMAQKLGKTKARACTIIGYADGNGNTQFFEGSVSGAVVSLQGTSGFGWDHIFVPDGYDQTFARMGMEKKNQISPRALAVCKLRDFLG